jgi:hypothetical protein
VKRLILAASLALAVLALPASALAHSNYAICHDGSLSDDVGQGCTNDWPYIGHWNAICYDGILSDDVGQGCTNDGPYIGTQRYYPTPVRSYQRTTTSSYGGGGGAGGVPACASESGTNYSTGAANTNPSSGATGRYQIIPSTASAYGCDLSTPAGQDACAVRIYHGQGAGAWVGCGG